MEKDKPDNQEFNKPKEDKEATPSQGKDMEFLGKAHRYAAEKRNLTGSEVDDPGSFESVCADKLVKLGRADALQKEDPKEFGAPLCRLAREYKGFEGIKDIPDIENAEELEAAANLGRDLFMESCRKVFPKPKINLEYGLELSKGTVIMNYMMRGTTYEKAKEDIMHRDDLSHEKRTLEINPREFLGILKMRFEELADGASNKAQDIFEFEYNISEGDGFWNKGPEQFTEVKLTQTKDIIFRSAQALYELQTYMDFLEQDIKDKEGIAAARATIQGKSEGTSQLPEEKPLPTVSSKRKKPAPPRE